MSQSRDQVTNPVESNLGGVDFSQAQLNREKSEQDLAYENWLTLLLDFPSGQPGDSGQGSGRVEKSGHNPGA